MASTSTVPSVAPQPWLALATLANLHHLAADPVAMMHACGQGMHSSASDAVLVDAAKAVGLRVKLTRTKASRFTMTPLPALARMRLDDGRMQWVLVAQQDPDKVLLQDPSGASERPVTMPIQSFMARWAPDGVGELMLASSQASLIGAVARFDFTWFIPAIVRYRKLLAEVFAVSLVLQLFALVSPLFFQVVMDKVLVHHSLATLDVLVIGLLVVVIFESVLNGLRSYVFSHTTSRIDVELGSRLFQHLLKLPLTYFQNRRVGDSVARVYELDHIRQFLTGNALTLVLDVLFSVVFIAIMLTYSIQLTLLVLVSLPLYFALVTLVVPVLRARLDEKFYRGAENQAMLVETVTGIQTVKAGALEPMMVRRWDNQLASYVQASFRTQNLASWANEGINVIGKIINAALLWLGAKLVIDGDLSVGQLVAFNMFANKVTQPIMRIAQMWTDFQQIGISMGRLADILDTRTELPPGDVLSLPEVKGHLTFDSVVFRYKPDAPTALRGVSLDVPEGQVIGIVGRSGSGKSTLTKLLQRLYLPEQGRILIDGLDIGLMDASQLRRHIGVVLQDNFLFNRSIRDNIAISDPSAPMDAVVQAAKMAGAHEFICELSQGYETTVGEHGSSLSGGQRQRIAIARALFHNPRVLIFDEATSALDYESEAIIQRNMASICKGRTVLIIAHRLSAVRNAHRIIVMDKGQIIESGPHEELLVMPRGAYARLWGMQLAHDTEGI